MIFAVVDALLGTNVSATCSSLNLQMLFSLSIMYNCIYILPFLGFKDTPFANFASTSHVFDNVKMLPIKILHLQSPRTHYRRYRRSISIEFYLLHNLSQYITYPKIYALMCLPLMESEQEFLYQFFVRNVLPPNELNSNPSRFRYLLLRGLPDHILILARHPNTYSLFSVFHPTVQNDLP